MVIVGIYNVVFASYGGLSLKMAKTLHIWGIGFKGKMPKNTAKYKFGFYTYCKGGLQMPWEVKVIVVIFALIILSIFVGVYI